MNTGVSAKFPLLLQTLGCAHHEKYAIHVCSDAFCFRFASNNLVQMIPFLMDLLDEVQYGINL